MDDLDIVERIGKLTDEEHRLELSHAGTALDQGEIQRLQEIEVALDQCWDLLRQRRARREFGQDPDSAAARPASVVENYRQ